MKKVIEDRVWEINKQIKELISDVIGQEESVDDVEILLEELGCLIYVINERKKAIKKELEK